MMRRYTRQTPKVEAIQVTWDNLPIISSLAGVKVWTLYTAPAAGFTPAPSDAIRVELTKPEGYALLGEWLLLSGGGEIRVFTDEDFTSGYRRID